MRPYSQQRTGVRRSVRVTTFGAIVVGFLCYGFRVTAKTASPSASMGGSLKAFLQLPLSFEPAPPKTGASVPSSFIARGPGYTLSLGPDAVIVALANGATSTVARVSGVHPVLARALGRPGAFVTAADGDKQTGKAAQSSPELVRLQFVGANPSAQADGLDPLPGTSNYIIGNDPKGWRTNVPTFARVRYASVYPGVDLVYYGSPQRLEYDLIVKPGADANAIRFTVTNSSGDEHSALRITPDGDLAIPTPRGELLLQRPVVYQDGPKDDTRTGVHTARKLVKGRYVLASTREVAFELGDYDHRQNLVIDPTLVYSSFLGGSGWDFGVSAAVGVDSAGNLYIASGTQSADFPGASGYKGASPDCDLGGGHLCGDAFVTKINASGTAIVYSTYLGGSGAEGAYGLAVDGAGDAYVTGPTDSTDFPTTAGAFQTSFGGDTAGCASAHIWPPCGDAFVTKLGPTGSVIYSTYLGGSSNDYAEAVALDGSGNAYITGQTYSSDYPTTTGAFQQTAAASICSGTTLCTGILTVSKLNAAGSSLVYSTYVGGTQGSGSTATAIAVDAAGEAYVTGNAGWIDFPTTPNAFQATDDSAGGSILVKLDSTGGSLLYSTFLGGSSWEVGLGITVDASGNAYPVGLTNSPDFPVTPGAFQMPLRPNITYSYVAKFDPSKSGAASLVFSTLMDAGILGVAVDSAGNVFLGGGTDAPDFPVVEPLQGVLATGTSCGGPCGDVLVAELDPTGSQLLFSTFLGGTLSEYAEFLARDSSGNLYVGGGTNSPDLPVKGGWAPGVFGGGGSDMFVAKISPLPNTRAGTNVVAGLNRGRVGVSFGNVTAAGTTAVAESGVGPATPHGFTLGDPSLYFDISTTATFSGNATVCLNYAGITFSGAPRLLHFENGSWVNVTTSIDTSQQIICGQVTSFSPFAVFGAVYHATVQQPVSADGTSTFKAVRGSVPVKFALTLGGEPTCTLDPAIISIYRISTSNTTAVNEDVYNMPSDAGSQFRIDSASCQYVYNVNARALGPGKYRVDISLYGVTVGTAWFSLQ